MSGAVSAEQAAPLEPAAAPGGVACRTADAPAGAAGSGRRRRLVGPAPFLVVLAVGALLRAATTLAYQPALEFHQDSLGYLDAAASPYPDVIRPVGYSFFLRLLSLGGALAAVPVAQHLLGLVSGALVHLLLRRFGVPAWAAALGSSPVLLGAYHLNIEQFVLAESLFTLLVVAAFVLLLWSRRPGVAACAAAGTLLGAAAVTRTVGLPLVALATVFLLVTRAGAARVVGVAAPAALVVGAYAAWFASVNGTVGLESYTGYFLAGRVSPLADCASLPLPPSERPLCDEEAVAAGMNTDWFVWNPNSPLRDPEGPPGPVREARAMRFALRVIRHQPLDYLRSVGGDLAHYFGPGRHAGPQDGDMRAWEFRTGFRLDPWQPAHRPSDPYVWNWTWPGNHTVTHGTMPAVYGFGLERQEPAFRPSLGRPLRAYQRVAYVPGPLLAAALLVAFAAGAGRLAPGLRRLRSAALLLASGGLVMVLLPAATATFDYRYLLPAEPLVVASGVLGAVLAAARLGQRRGRQGAAAAVSAPIPVRAPGPPRA